MTAHIPAAAAVAAAAGGVFIAARLVAGRRALRVLGASVRRQALALASYRFRLVVTTINALLLAAVVIFAGRAFIGPAIQSATSGAGNEVVLYIATGVVSWPTAWAGYRASASTLRREQVLGTLEVVQATPAGLGVVPLAALVTEGVRTFLGSSLVGLLIVTAVPLGLGASPTGIPVALAGLVLAALFLWGVGLAFAGLTVHFKELGGIEAIMRFALIMTTGVFFPLHLLPTWLAVAGQWIPLTVAFEFVRASALGVGPGPDVGVRFLLLALAAVVSVACGNWALKRTIDRARRRGTLYGY